MLNQEVIKKLCTGLENVDRKDGIINIIAKVYSRDEATEYYNLWRRQYVTTLVNIS